MNFEDLRRALTDYVTFTVRNIVDTPEVARVDIKSTTDSIDIEIDVDKSDTGKVIGKNGETVKSIRRICNAIKKTMAPDEARRVRVGIIEKNKQY